jgi:hypothetical protein
MQVLRRDRVDPVLPDSMPDRLDRSAVLPLEPSTPIDDVRSDGDLRERVSCIQS